jgi:HAD superfamily hydrolase (TIGR01450 family)
MTLTTPAFTLHTSFSTILPLYDSFLLDQFGVIHNGSKSLHGAVNCIETMVRENKKLAILSNTSSPSHVALGKLSKYGLRQDMFVGGLVSSGEECSKFVRGEYCSGSAAQTKALWFTWKESEKQSPLEFLQCCENEGNKIGVAECVTEADFILLHGSEVWRRQRELTEDSSTDPIQDLNFMYNQDFSVIDPILKAAAQLNLPMVCANPDLVVTLQGGVKANMPGQIARRYETMRGRVTQFGKPNPSHFISCVKNMGISTEHSKHIPGVAHVGDSLEHDVVGANAAGIDSIFVIGGIHAADLGLELSFTILEDDQKSTAANSVTKQDLTLRLQRLFGEHGIYPTHVVPSLSLS